MSKEVPLEVLSVLILTIVGAIGVLRPAALQAIGLRNARFNPWSRYISTDAYLRHTRIVGVAALGIAAVLTLDLYIRWLRG
jgi:hypothetical protein